MALPVDRIEILINHSRGTSAVRLYDDNTRLRNDSFHAGNIEQWFGGSRATATITAAKSGTPIYATPDNRTTWYAFDEDDEDAMGTPVVHPLEDWMWDYYILDDENTRTARRVARVTPTISTSVVVSQTKITEYRCAGPVDGSHVFGDITGLDRPSHQDSTDA